MNTIEETIKKAGWGKRKIMRKQIELFEKELLEDEELLGAVASYPKPKEQLYVTNKRVISHKLEGLFDNTRVEIPLSSISSINVKSKGLRGTAIEIVASNNKASVDNVMPDVAQEIKKLIDSLIM